jgi:(5-formylfuran-3-yl)methyl phosphate synthase
MRLLVSVANGDDAAAALAGGADIIDAKDPATGPLGAVTIEVLREIAAAARGRRLLTAALGDAADEDAVERAAGASAAAGVNLIKLGFAGIARSARVAALLRAARRGAAAGSRGGCGVVAVAYADAARVASLRADDLVDTAAAAGATGVLLDTAHKHGPGLRALLSQDALSAWVLRAHQAALMVAVAGRLQIDDLDFVRDAGADVAGVRGAACEGGRTGRITTERVYALRRACEGPLKGGPEA